MSSKNIDLALLTKRVELLELNLQALQTMDPKVLEPRLKKIESLLYVKKEMLTQQEAADYLGVSMSQLYKMTHKCEVPFYKPHGKNNFFDVSELAQWMIRNRVKPTKKQSPEVTDIDPIDNDTDEPEQ